MMRLLGSGNPPLSRRVAVEFAVSGYRDMSNMITQHSALARRLAGRLGLPEAVQEAVGTAYEQWDGKGWPGDLRGDAIPIRRDWLRSESSPRWLTAWAAPLPFPGGDPGRLPNSTRSWPPSSAGMPRSFRRASTLARPGTRSSTQSHRSVSIYRPLNSTCLIWPSPTSSI